jgi:RNA polymerase sigma factor (sigma-70 family)
LEGPFVRPPDFARIPFEEVLRQFEPLLRKQAALYARLFPCHESDDYYQVAAVGLWKAHERLRQGRLLQPERFAGYARRVIRSEVNRWLGRCNDLVRIPEGTIRGRRPTDIYRLLSLTQPLRLEGPAPTPDGYPRPIPLAEVVAAPDVDLDLRVAVRTGLARMQCDRRLVLLARAEGWSPAEIAERTGYTVRQVHALAWRARRELAVFLEEETGTGRG